jgi:excisionase family DNA binding protein
LTATAPRSAGREEETHQVTAQKLSYRIDEAAEATGLSRQTIYRLIAKGELTSFKVGTRTLIIASVLQDFLDRCAQASMIVAAGDVTESS